MLIQLPQGPSSDFYRIYLFVNIIDDSYGKTVYNIPTSVTVMPNDALANTLIDAISSQNTNSPVYATLNSGDLNLVAKNVIALSTVFNIQSNTMPTSNVTAISAQNNQMATLREFFFEKIGNLSISDMSSIKLIASAFSAATDTPVQISSKSAVILKYKLYIHFLEY